MWDIISSIANVTWFVMVAVYLYYALIAWEIGKAAPLWCKVRERGYRLKWVRRIEMAADGEWGRHYQVRAKRATYVLVAATVPVVMNLIHWVSGYLARAFFN